VSVDFWAGERVTKGLRKRWGEYRKSLGAVVAAAHARLDVGALCVWVKALVLEGEHALANLVPRM
jgi:hypothetical protein